MYKTQMSSRHRNDYTVTIQSFRRLYNKNTRNDKFGLCVKLFTVKSLEICLKHSDLFNL